MIRARIGTSDGDTGLIGLTDVNLKRLQEGKPVDFDMRSLGPAGAHGPTRIVIFHATRESLIELARTVGMDEKDLLDQLGEG